MHSLAKLSKDYIVSYYFNGSRTNKEEIRLMTWTISSSVFLTNKYKLVVTPS